MKVLILGSGAKDHALAWAMAKSHIISGLFVAPGNSGTAEIAENLDYVNITDPSEVVKLCSSLEIDYCFVGDTTALLNGVADALVDAGSPSSARARRPPSSRAIGFLHGIL